VLSASERRGGQVLTLRSQFSFTRMLLGFYGIDIRIMSRGRTILRAYKIAVDDAGRMHIFEPTLNDKDKNRRVRRGKVGLTRIWYKKY